jgi:hypothetical protein
VGAFPIWIQTALLACRHKIRFCVGMALMHSVVGFSLASVTTINSNLDNFRTGVMRPELYIKELPHILFAQESGTLESNVPMDIQLENKASIFM